MSSMREIDARGCHRAFGQADRPCRDRRLRRMPHMNNSWYRSEHAQVAASVDNTCLDTARFQGSYCAIDCETFGDSAKIDNQVSTKEDAAILAKKNVPPCCGVIRLMLAFGKIAPARQKLSGRDIKHSVGFLSKMLRGFEHLPGPRVDDYAFWKCFTIHSGDVAMGIVKTHQPMYFFNSGECRGDGTLQTGRVGPRSCDFHKCAQQWSTSANFDLSIRLHSVISCVSARFHRTREDVSARRGSGAHGGAPP